MKAFNNTEGIVCCKTIKHTMRDVGIIGSSKCNRPASHTNDTHYFCRKHSRTGRFVARIGDVGEIRARFDTEAELRAHIHEYPGTRMQKITSSHRRDLY
jgi:hypothetical protein